MKIELYDNDHWMVVGPDIENPQAEDDPLVKVELGKTEDGPLVVTMYKELLNDLRNHIEGYEAIILINYSSGSISFNVSYNGRFIPYAP